MLNISVNGALEVGVEAKGSHTVVAAELLVAIRMISSQWDDKVKADFIDNVVDAVKGV